MERPTCPWTRLKTAPLSSLSAPRCLHTQTHLQRKPACDACSHAANEEACRALCCERAHAYFTRHKVSNIGLKGWFWVVEEHIRQAAVALHTIVSYRSRLFCIVSRKWLQDGFQHIRRHSKEKRAENVTKTCRFRSKLS